MHYGDPFNKNVPLENFLEVLDTQCVQFRDEESDLYPIEEKYGSGSEITNRACAKYV